MVYVPFLQQAGVLIALFDAEANLGHVEKSPDSDGAVDAEAGQFRRGSGRFALKSIIHDPTHYG